MRMELDHPSTEQHHSDDNSATEPQPTSPSIHPPTIPDSVRGAPEALKPAIRKKQNKESARRSRKRRKELVQNLTTSIGMLIEKTQELETRLDSIAAFLSKSGFEAFSQPRLRYPVMTGMSLPSSDAGPSHSGSLVLGSDGSQTRGQPSAPASAPKNQEKKELDDDDVEKLIASCLEQL